MTVGSELLVTYHQVSIAYVVLDQPSAQDDHAAVDGSDRLAVHFTDICSVMCKVTESTFQELRTLS